MNLTQLAENVGLEPEEFSEIFEIYAETTSTDLEELRAAMNAGDAEKAHEKAHSIKGASGNLGLMELYELSKEIDDNVRAGKVRGLEGLMERLTAKYENLLEEFQRSSRAIQGDCDA